MLLWINIWKMDYDIVVLKRIEWAIKYFDYQKFNYTIKDEKVVEITMKYYQGRLAMRKFKNPSDEPRSYIKNNKLIV